MSKRRSRVAIAKQPAPEGGAALTQAPPPAAAETPAAFSFDPRSLKRPSNLRRLLLALGVVLCVAVAVGLLIDLGPTAGTGGWSSNFPVGAPGDAAEQPPTWQPTTEEERLVDQFVRLHNAGDPTVGEMLGGTTAVPEGPVTEEAAQRLQTDFFLRDKVEVVDVWRKDYGEPSRPLPPSHYLLVTRGNVAAPTVSVQTGGGVERSQRTMSNPDLIVEVKGGKVFGIRAQLHVGP